MQLIEKSPQQIKKQIIFWFLNYHDKTQADFNGTELFTLFELKSDNVKKKLAERANFRANEIPVLVLNVNDEEAIINTTERFIKIEKNGIQYIKYSDFEWHNGFKSIYEISAENSKPHFVKIDGKLSEFGLRKRNGEIVYWKIPTGGLDMHFGM